MCFQTKCRLTPNIRRKTMSNIDKLIRMTHRERIGWRITCESLLCHLPSIIRVIRILECYQSKNESIANHLGSNPLLCITANHLKNRAVFTPSALQRWGRVGCLSDRADFGDMRACGGILSACAESISFISPIKRLEIACQCLCRG